MEDLLRFNFEQKYIVLDTETEGLNLLNSRPWQISWITAKGKLIQTKNDRFAKWNDLNISDDAARVTGFDVYKYDCKAEDPALIVNDLWSVLSDPNYLIIGQNILNFDVYILNVLRKYCGLKPDNSYINRIIDTRALAMAIALGHKQIDKNDVLNQFRFINYRDKKIKTSQASLLKHYAIDHDPSKLHDGMYDIEMTFKIFQKQIQEIDI
jgi:DNA polymerase III epsilon subunit-like protein